MGETGTTETEICVLCCRSYTQSLETECAEPGDLIVSAFCKEIVKSANREEKGSAAKTVHYRGKSTIEKGEDDCDKHKIKALVKLLSSDLKVCASCLELLQNACEAKDCVMEVEVNVRALQLQLLTVLKELKLKLEYFHKTMGHLGKLVKSSDGHWKRKHTTGTKEDSKSTVAIVALREEIANTSHALNAFNENIAERLLQSTHTGQSTLPTSRCSRTPHEDFNIKLEDFDSDNDDNQSQDYITPDCFVNTSDQVSPDGPMTPQNNDFDDVAELKPVNNKSFMSFGWTKKPLKGAMGLGSSYDDGKTPIKQRRNRNATLTSYTGMSTWRRKIVSRVLSRLKIKDETSISCEQSRSNSKKQINTDPDPRSKYTMNYDFDTGTLSVGDIDGIRINDKEEKVECSRCTYRNGEPSKGHNCAERLMFNHVLGHHFNAFKCKICEIKFLRWNSYSSHVKKHSSANKVKKILGASIDSSTEKDEAREDEGTRKVSNVRMAEVTARRLPKKNFAVSANEAVDATSSDSDLLPGKDLSKSSEDSDSDWKEMGAKTSSAKKIKKPLKRRNKKQRPFSDNIDYTGMSSWRISIISRVLLRLKTKMKMPLSSDPRAKYEMKYDFDTGTLSVGEIDNIKINDEDESIECPKCPYRSKEPVKGQNPADRFMFNHVIGHHLDGFNCNDCDAKYTSWNSYATHIKGHATGRIRIKNNGVKSSKSIGTYKREVDQALSGGEDISDDYEECTDSANTYRIANARERERRIKRPRSYHEGVDCSKMPKWRAAIVSRVLFKSEKLRTENSSKQAESSVFDDDPRLQYTMAYNSETSTLSIGEIDGITFNDDDHSLQCPKCSHRTKEHNKGNNHSERFMSYHILGHHLNAFRCETCDIKFVSWSSYTKHARLHENERIPSEKSVKMSVKRKLCQNNETSNNDEAVERRTSNSYVKFETTSVYPTVTSNPVKTKSSVNFPIASDRVTKPSDDDYQKMSNWRKNIVSRVLAKQEMRQTQSFFPDSEFSDGTEDSNEDPRIKYSLKYDVITGYLSAGSFGRIKINDKGQTIDCPKCPYRARVSLSTKVSPENCILHHVLGHHLKVLRCKPCKLRFLQWGTYQLHMSSHKRPRQLECNICGKPLRRNVSMELHLWTHMSSNDKRQARKEGRFLKCWSNSSKVKDPSYICSTCGKSLRTADGLKYHERTQHRESVENKTELCIKCGQRFTPSGMYYHRQYVCGEAETPSVKCSICPSKTFSNRYLLRQHFRRIHTDAGRERKFVCSICSSRLRTKSDYEIHLLRHKGIRQFVCEKGCGADFHCRRHSRRHEKNCKGPGSHVRKRNPTRLEKMNRNVSDDDTF